MQSCTKQMADYIRARAQSPIAFVVAQLPVDGTGTSADNPMLVNNQFVMDKVTSVQISRSTDRTSDTCSVTIQDDTFQYAAFRGDGQGAYSTAFQPGVITNRFQVYCGFQGQNYFNPQGLSGSSSITDWAFAPLLRFTGTLETDDNQVTPGVSNVKSMSLIDLTNQFKFDVYDTFPHPIYGNQTLPYFDPSYNLTNPSADGITWQNIGKMFTVDTDSLVYGSTHIEPAFFVDFSCGQTPQATALNYDPSRTTFDSTSFIKSYYGSGGDPLWTFDYNSGKVTFTTQFISDHQGDAIPNKIASLTANSIVGATSFSVDHPELFVVGGTIILGLPTDTHQEQLVVTKVTGSTVVTSPNSAAHTHSSGDPAMGNWTVSIAGNPTYMAPEEMIQLILCTKGNWDPKKLKLDTSHVLINQYLGQDMAAWDCIKEICDLTCPRFMPWIMHVDTSGVLHFEEVQSDAPSVKRFVDKRDFLDCDLSYTSQGISTVVRAEGECYTDEGDQSVTSLAFNMKSIARYGQTEPLLLDQHLTYNVRQLTTTQAVSYMNMLTASVLGQVSQPVLTLTADIWPDATLEINDKITVYDSDLGLDRDFIITAINENLAPGTYQIKITAQEVLNPTNYMIGLPAGVTYDNLLLPASGTIPATSLIKEIRLGTGQGVYVYKDWQPTQDPITLDDMAGKWVANGEPMHFDIFFDAKKPPKGGANPYSYHNLPPQITDWAPSQAPGTGDTVYYGTQPGPSGIGSPAHSGWTVYVGPDSVFYTFNHAAPIGPADLGDFWLPPGNDHVPGGGTGTQAWDGYVWCWFYLCLDGDKGSGKNFRPLMRLDDPGLSSQPFHVPVGGKQRNISWNHGPGPTFTGNNEYYYGNLVVGISDITPVPDGFVGARVHNGGRGSSKGHTTVNWPDGNPYWSYKPPGQTKTQGGPGWMPGSDQPGALPGAVGTNPVPVANASVILPGDVVNIGTGGHQENNVPIVHVDVSGSTITIDSSYNGGKGTKQPHYGGPPGQPDAGGFTAAPIDVQSAGGGMPDNTNYGVAYGASIPQQDIYVNYRKKTLGCFCAFVMSTDGATQFVRIPFYVYI